MLQVSAEVRVRMIVQAGKVKEESGAPVSPDPPVRDVLLGQQEATNKQQHQEEEAAACAGNNLIAGQGSQESKHGNAHAVHQEKEQDACEEPAHQHRRQLERTAQ